MEHSPPDRRELLLGGSDDERVPARAPSDLCPAAAWPRLWALVLDATTVGLAAVVATFGVWIVSLPFWQVDDRATRGRSVQALGDAVPGWVGWVALAVLACSLVVLSGALSARGKRRSLGLRLAELSLSRATFGATDRSAERTDATGVEPAAWRVAARWLLPLIIFGVLAPLGGWAVATAVTLALWLPALTGSRRSVYDLAVGVVVVDPVRSIRRAQDAASRRPRAS